MLAVMRTTAAAATVEASIEFVLCVVAGALAFSSTAAATV